MSGAQKRMWAQAVERDRAKRKREGAPARGPNEVSGPWQPETGPKRCYRCSTFIVPQAGRTCRVLVVFRQEMDVDGDGKLTNPGPSQTLVYHGPCGAASDREACEFHT